MATSPAMASDPSKDVTPQRPSGEPVIVTTVSSANSNNSQKMLVQPSAIIPDDTRTDMRAEDVLPFFQQPGTKGGVIVTTPGAFVPPQPSTPVVPSSATYIQK